MATAAPFVKLLRQLSGARDDYRSGALDVTWDGGGATLFVVFGQPNHATYRDEIGESLEGPEALSALVHHLPPKFKVEPWRKEVVRNESLNLSMDELLEPFATLAGANSADQVSEDQPGDNGTGVLSGDGRPPVTIRLETFPLLPIGQSLWSEADASVVHLDVLIPKLPTSLIVLTGTKLRAAAIIDHGSIIDAIWIDEDEPISGEGAAMALMGAREGTVSGYRLDDGRFAEAITLLWRSPIAHDLIKTEWIDTKKFLASLQSERIDRAVTVDSSSGRGVGLFMTGQYLGGYSDKHREPSIDIKMLERLLNGADGTVTIRQRASDVVPVKPNDEMSYHHQPADAPATAGEAAPFLSTEMGYDEFPVDLASEVAQRTPVVAEEAPAWLRPSQAPHFDADAPDEAVATTTEDKAHEPASDDQLIEPEPPESATVLWLDPTAPPLPAAWSNAEPTSDEPGPGESLPPGVAAAWGGFAPDDEPDSEPPGVAAAWGGFAPDDETDSDAPSHAPGDDDATAPTVTAAEMLHPPEAGGHSDGNGHGDAGSERFFSTASWMEATNGVPAGVQPDYEPAAADPGVGTHSWLTPAEAPDQPTIDVYAPWPAPPVEHPDHPHPIAGYPDDDMLDDDTANEPRLDLDFETIKADLVQIGVRWVGSDHVEPVAVVIKRTRHRVDDFVATIDTIRTMVVPGHDASVIRAMAREMHYYAAEALCSA